MKRHKLIIGILVFVFFIAVGIVLEIIYSNENVLRNEKVQELVETYQLPNGMFFDSMDKGESIDAFSTCYAQKIRQIVYQEEISLVPTKLGFTYNNIDEIYYLQDVFVFLSDDVCGQYEKYITEQLFQEDGLVTIAEDEDEKSRLIFTLYVIKFAEQYEIELKTMENTKNNIKHKLDLVSKEDSIFYISTLLELADVLEIEYDKNFFATYYNTKMNDFESLSLIADDDIMNLYYLSRMENIINSGRTISIRLTDTVVDAISYSYTNLSLFYDCLCILETYTVLQDNLQFITEYVEILEEYELNDGYYSSISVINPSILATFCGVEMLRDIDSIEPNKKAIESYLTGYFAEKIICEMSCEEQYYYYQTLVLLDSKLLEEDLLYQEILKALIYKLETADSLSIRELYCAKMLNEIYFCDDNINELIDNCIVNIQDTVEINELSVANYCMLLILSFDSNYKISQNVDNLESKLISIMDAYYYNEYCEVYDIDVNIDAIENILHEVKNKEGYYISKYQKINSMFTLYMGYSLENNIR